MRTPPLRMKNQHLSVISTRLDVLVLLVAIGVLLSVQFIGTAAQENQNQQQNQNQDEIEKNIKYNQIQQKGSHNSYERYEGLLDQMIYHNLRSIEIDCRRRRSGGGGSKKRTGEFLVFHDSGYLQSYSNINKLDDGVDILLEFHSLFPKHHVITIFMDFKDGFNEESHAVEIYDSIIGRLPLWTPSDARPYNESSIQDGIDQNGWPTIDELRGKFIFVITDGQSTYCNTNDECKVRKAFIASAVTSVNDIGNNTNTVFYNQNAKYKGIGPAIYQRGYISRVWDAADITTSEQFINALTENYNFIATNKINFHQDPWSRTHNANGYPFFIRKQKQNSDNNDDKQNDNNNNMIDVSNWDPKEGVDSVIYLYANNGDTWGRVDYGNFVYFNMSNVIIPVLERNSNNDSTDLIITNNTSNSSNINGDSTTSNTNVNENETEIGNDSSENDSDWFEYTTTISLANSHCEGFAKAGIMFREENPSLFPVATGQYFSVMRTCRFLMRVQYRQLAYMFTTSKSIAAIDASSGIESSKRTTIMARYKYDGLNSFAEGYVWHPEDESYHLVDRQFFPNVKFTLHGIFASSHYWEGNKEDGSEFKALFLNTKLNGETLYASNFTDSYGGDDDITVKYGQGFFGPDDPSAVNRNIGGLQKKGSTERRLGLRARGHK